MIDRRKFLVIAVVLIFLIASFVPSQAKNSQPSAPVLVFVSDGMRQDLLKEFVAEGALPTYQYIFSTGVVGVKGMVPTIASNTGPGWTSLMTGAHPSRTGVTNNTFHDNTLPFQLFGVSAWAAGVNQAQTLVEQAQSAGKNVAVFAWQAFDYTILDGGVFVDYYPDWFTGRGIVANYNVPLQWTHILSPGFFLANNQVTLADASGWVNIDPSYSPAQETSFTVPSFYGPIFNYYVYISDSSDDGITNYDRVTIAPTKDGQDVVATLGAGEWSESVDVDVIGMQGSLYFKLIDLEEDLSKFRLYFTPATRFRALPDSLEDYLVENFDPIMPIDYSPYILGLVDEQTFMEQHLQATAILGEEIYPYIIRTYQPDLVLAGNEPTDAITHRFLALATPGTEVYDPDRGPVFRDYIRQAYQSSDRMLNAMWAEMPGANVIVTSDHGFSNTWMAINASYILETLGLYIPGNPAGSKAVPYIAGGTAQIYINLQGRNPGGIVPPESYETVRQQIVQAFQNLGPEVIEKVLLKEDTASIRTATGLSVHYLHPDRTGDVVVFSAPPYQFDAPTAGQVLAPAPIYGQHGFVPTGDVDRYAVFAAAGPNIRKGNVPRVTAFDVAPTAAYLLGIPAPVDSEGVILKITKK